LLVHGTNHLRYHLAPYNRDLIRLLLDRWVITGICAMLQYICATKLEVINSKDIRLLTCHGFQPLFFVPREKYLPTPFGSSLHSLHTAVTADIVSLSAEVNIQSYYIRTPNCI
jgi:hypothetical protein